MKQTVTLAMAMSLDGKTTKWSEHQIHTWTSKEDRATFSSLLTRQTAVVMGRKTFFVARRLWKQTPNLLRIVYTQDPSRYRSFAEENRVEFTKESPKLICQALAKCGHSHILLIGGPQINTLFLEVGLVDELLLTLEPWLFGRGTGIFLPKKMALACTLKEVCQLNKQGTLLLKYNVKTSPSFSRSDK